MPPHASQTNNPYNTVALYNAKGGTGKTTVGVNVAGALTQHGHDVLFVDLDPQGNATEGLGLVEAYDDSPPNLFDIMIGEADPDEINEIVEEHQEFDVIPSNVDMLNAERELVIMDYEGDDSYSHLGDGLAALDTDYDYVLIDSPPFFGEISDTALYTAQNVLIPALTEATSQRAVELLLDQIEHLEKQERIAIRELGAVANRIETNNEAEHMKEWLERAFPDVPVFNVRKRVALQRAHANGVSIFEHEESSDMEDVFLDIAVTLEEQFAADVDAPEVDV